MKNIGRILIILAILVASGCQQSRQEKTAGISRKDKLMASENLNLKSELSQCQNELEKHKKLLEQCRQENKKLTQNAAETAKENLNFKNELAQCHNEIEKQKNSLEQCQQMVDLKDVPALCRDKVEKQKKLLEQCRQEKEQLRIDAGNSSTFFMNQLPADLLKQNEQLTQENEQLKAKIGGLEKAAKDINEIPKDVNEIQKQQ